MGKMSIDKGAAFERQIARELSLWLSGRTRKDWCCRSRGSGAQVHHRTMQGDISGLQGPACDLLELLWVECKFWRDLRITSLLTGKSNDLIRVWNRLNRQATHHKKHAALVMKQNYNPIYLAVRPELAIAIQKSVINRFTLTSATFPLYKMTILIWEQVLEHCTPTVLLEVLKGHEIPAHIRLALNSQRKGRIPLGNIRKAKGDNKQTQS